MKAIFALFKVILLVFFSTNSIFSQKGDTVTVIDFKSFMEPYLNKDPDTIAYIFTQKPAAFPGGRDSLDKFIKRYLLRESTQFPKNKVKILSWVTIEKNGCTSNVEIIVHNDITSDLENGITKALYSSPMWSPATQDGKRLRYKTIIVFNSP